ncbi:DUF2723 domain-containing protein, partial [bacterium]|nr:DUF2723 domain-containing protein [bacterium]MBU1024664.1 DUF2723 domain-containing protein [bacterium]
MTNSSKRVVLFPELALVFLAAFIVYSLSISYNYFQAHNGIYYINNIDPVPLNLTGAEYEKFYIANLDPVNDIFHPHHLLHVPLAMLWLKILRVFSPNADSLTLVTYLSTFFGSLTLCVFYSIMRMRLNLSKAASAVATMLPAFSFAFWFYSSVVEIYMIPMFFLLLILFILTSEKVSSETFLWVGFLHAVAMLVHQSNVLFLPIVIGAAYLYRKNENLSFLKNLLFYAVTVIPLVVIPYLLIMIIALKLVSYSEMITWLTTYGHESSYWVKPSLRSIPFALRGFLRSLVGAHFMSAVKPIAMYDPKSSVASWEIPYTFLVRNIDPLNAKLYLAYAAIFFGVIIVKIAVHIREIKNELKTNKEILTLSLIWFCAYTLFFMFWVPTNPDYWIPQSVCGWIIFMIIGTPLKKGKFKYGILSFIGLCFIAIFLFSLNFFGSINPLHKPENDYYYQNAKHLASIASKKDVVITGQHY